MGVHSESEKIMAGRRKRKSRGGHRMTPARKAALRKAQLASARKRRRKAHVKKVGRVVGGVAASAAVAGLSYGLHHPGKSAKNVKAVYKFGNDRIKNRKGSNPSRGITPQPPHWGEARAYL